MKITITGRKVNLRDSFKELVNKKLSKFERFFGDDADDLIDLDDPDDAPLDADELFDDVFADMDGNDD